MDFERPGSWKGQPEQIDEFEQRIATGDGAPAGAAQPEAAGFCSSAACFARSAVHSHTIWWQRLAASVLLAGVIAGGYSWRQVEDRRKGEEAAQQVLTALRITNRALNDMNRRLAARNREEK